MRLPIARATPGLLCNAFPATLRKGCLVEGSRPTIQKFKASPVFFTAYSYYCDRLSRRYESEGETRLTYVCVGLKV